MPSFIRRWNNSQKTCSIDYLPYCRHIFTKKEVSLSTDVGNGTPIIVMQSQVNYFKIQSHKELTQH